MKSIFYALLSGLTAFFFALSTGVAAFGSAVSGAFVFGPIAAVVGFLFHRAKKNGNLSGAIISKEDTDRILAAIPEIREFHVKAVAQTDVAKVKTVAVIETIWATVLRKWRA